MFADEMTTAAIVQSNYLPWKGYFDLIRRSDVFVFLDDVQYTPRDWRNRNLVKLPNGGVKWITVPVLGGREQLICEATIDRTTDWPRKHLGAIRESYAKAPFFERYYPRIEAILRVPPASLSTLNRSLIEAVCEWLNIQARFVGSEELGIPGRKDDKLLGILREVGATRYLSGPSARSYIDAEKFAKAGIDLEFIDYSHYPEYPQISKPFVHGVTILDLVFMMGPDSSRFIWDEER